MDFSSHCWPHTNGLLRVSAEECGCLQAGGRGSTLLRPWSDHRHWYLTAELFTTATHFLLPPPGPYVSFMPHYNQVCPLFRGLLQRKKKTAMCCHIIEWRQDWRKIDKEQCRWQRKWEQERENAQSCASQCHLATMSPQRTASSRLNLAWWHKLSDAYI